MNLTKKHIKQIRLKVAPQWLLTTAAFITCFGVVGKECIDPIPLPNPVCGYVEGLGCIKWAYSIAGKNCDSGFPAIFYCEDATVTATWTVYKKAPIFVLLDPCACDDDNWIQEGDETTGDINQDYLGEDFCLG